MFFRKKKKPKDQEPQAADEAAPQQREPAQDPAEPTGDQTTGKAASAPAEYYATPAPEEPTPQAHEPAQEPDPSEPEAPEAQEGDQALVNRDEPAAESAPPDQDDQPGFLGRLAQRLGKTRQRISGSIDRIALGKQIDEEVLEELEEVLVTADMGVATSLELIQGLRGKVARKELDDAAALKEALAQGIGEILAAAPRPPARDNHPHVIMVVGVNGVGKTTTIGKLAHLFKDQGHKVLLAAGDTFRAAAGEQLGVWAQRAGCELVRQQHGADPSAVAYDAVEAAVSRGADLVIIDTAGRLHTKTNLMDELAKIHRVLGKKLAGAPHEVLLVLDATTGQNAVSQAKMFNQAVPLTGLVLTKLDGTAKGGVVVSIVNELKLPVCYVGLGEKIEDLRPFDPTEFAHALL